MKKLITASILVFSVVILVSVSYYFFIRNSGDDEGIENQNKPLFTYISDDPIISSEHNYQELDDVRPGKINIYSYDDSGFLDDLEIKGSGDLFDMEMSSKMSENITMDGTPCWSYREGELELTRYIEITKMGEIDFKDRKNVGFTYNMTVEELLNITDNVTGKISIHEDLNITLIRKQKVAKYPFTEDQVDIGSFYWISMEQEINGLKVRGAHISVYIRNGEVVGYSDSRLYVENMRMLEHLANMYTSREASFFALEHLSREQGFDIEDLEVDDWEMKYGYDSEMKLITPIYTFHIEKDHRPYFVMVHGDKDHGGMIFED